MLKTLALGALLALLACAPPQPPGWTAEEEAQFIQLLREHDLYVVGGQSYAYPVLGYPVYELGMLVEGNGSWVAHYAIDPSCVGRSWQAQSVRRIDGTEVFYVGDSMVGWCR